jgi:pyrimidine operon attenuation protein/uracil phosphoribosyltransferase
VLIDRGHREMPIQPDYVGITLDTRRLDHVLVSLEGTDGVDRIQIVAKEKP